MSTKAGNHVSSGQPRPRAQTASAHEDRERVRSADSQHPTQKHRSPRKSIVQNIVSQFVLALVIGLVIGSSLMWLLTSYRAYTQPPPVRPEGEPTPARVAIELSRRAFADGGATDVLLTADTPSADALAASGLQGLLRAPLLLTSPYGLSPETAVEINRLGKPNIHIIGGREMVRRVIEEQLRAAGHEVHRHAGQTRVETSISIAERHFKDATTAILAPAQPESGDPIDSLTEFVAAGALAAQDRVPLLFTGAASLTPETEHYLRRSHLRSVVIVGNESAIRQPVIERLEDLGLKLTRVAGQDRYATAVAIAEQMGFHSPSDTDVVLLTDGLTNAWPAAYAAPFQAVRWHAPVLFTNGPELPPATREYLEAEGSEGSTFPMCMPGVMKEACTAGRTALGLS